MLRRSVPFHNITAVVATSCFLDHALEMFLQAFEEEVVLRRHLHLKPKTREKMKEKSVRHNPQKMTQGPSPLKTLHPATSVSTNPRVPYVHAVPEGGAQSQKRRDARPSRPHHRWRPIIDPRLCTCLSGQRRPNSVPIRGRACLRFHSIRSRRRDKRVRRCIESETAH